MKILGIAGRLRKDSCNKVLLRAAVELAPPGNAIDHLRQCFVFLDMHPVNQPEVMLAFAPQKFDDRGKLTDNKTQEMIRALLDALLASCKQVKSPALAR